MRLVIASFLLCILITPSIAQQQDFEKDRRKVYEDKIESYRIMERVGTNVAIGGGIAAIAGAYLLSDSNWIDDGSNHGTDDAAGIAGLVLLTKGIPVAIMGLVFRAISINTQRKYQQKLEQITFSPMVHPRATGVTITFTF